MTVAQSFARVVDRAAAAARTDRAFHLEGRSIAEQTCMHRFVQAVRQHADANRRARSFRHHGATVPASPLRRLADRDDLARAADRRPGPHAARGVCMTTPIPYEKPSRQERRQKRTWKRRKLGLTLSTSSRHHLHVAGKQPATGGESPKWSGVSRNAFCTVAIFSPWLCSSTGGRAGGAERLAGAPSVSQPPFRSPTSFESEVCGFKPQMEHTTMRTTASGTHAHTPESPRFTPGPWCRCGHRQIATTAGAGLTICEVWSGGVGIEQADANENLIVAAPDLFAALESALVVVAGCNADGLFDTEERAIREALKFAREGL